MKLYAFLVLFVVSGCSSSAPLSKKSENPGAGAIKENAAPQLWTFQKEITGSVEICAVKAESILKLQGFSNITKSVYDQHIYFYANFINNRAGIHCTSVGEKILVYGAVAGSDVKTVEALRNNISWKF
ncbi:MAG: hypothetical protein EOO52_15770 [Gammaproteobacteria bacterium]|nr:MAG: hypothetical protein EOO52_15770 [Gammaproteobacteria bacterium]